VSCAKVDVCPVSEPRAGFVLAPFSGRVVGKPPGAKGGATKEDCGERGGAVGTDDADPTEG